MTRRDRELLDLVEGLRAEMNLRLDALVAAIREDEAAGQGETKKAPRKRRAPLRHPYQGDGCPDGHRPGEGAGRAAQDGPRMKKNRSHGAGTLERLQSGRWRFKITGPDGKRRASPSFATREEAQSVLDAATYELAGGNLAPVGPVTLAGYGEAWCARRTCRSAEDERRLWRGHVAGTWIAAMPLADIKRRHIRDFVE